MFRPLLSSVPSSTFYAGKPISSHRPMISRNSSVTTSSNASSEQGTTIAPDTEWIDQNQDHMVSECKKLPSDPDTQDEVFVVVNEEISHESHDESSDIHHDNFLVSVHKFDGVPTKLPEDFNAESSELDGLEDELLCAKCGCSYIAIEPVEGNIKLCPDCVLKNECLADTTHVAPSVMSDESPVISTSHFEEYKAYDELETLTGVTDLQVTTNIAETKVIQYEESSNNEDQKCYTDTEGQRLQQLHDYRKSKVDISEGRGISVLLVKKTSSGKGGPVVQGRAFTPGVIPYDLSSIGRCSVSPSASSSMDLSSTNRIQRQLSGKRYDMDAKCQITNGEKFDLSFIDQNKDINDITTSVNEGLIAEEDNQECSENYRTIDYSTSDLSSCSVSIQLEDKSAEEFANIEGRNRYVNGEGLTNNARSISDVSTSSVVQEACLAEENTLLNDSVEGSDVVAESLTQNHVITISEIEIETGAQSISNSQSGGVVCINTKNVDEFQDPSVPTIVCDDVLASVPELSTSNQLITGMCNLELLFNCFCPMALLIHSCLRFLKHTSYNLFILGVLLTYF